MTYLRKSFHFYRTSRFFNRFLFGLGLFGLALIIMLTTAVIPTTHAQEEDPLTNLWIDFSLGTPLIEAFNAVARSNDIARVEHISQIDMLSQVTTGRKLVVFKSAADAVRLIPHIADEIDIVGYNLEHGTANPLNEQEDPIGSIRELRSIADEYGLQVALGPDHSFALSHSTAMAPYADMLILQVQKVQTDPETVLDFVRPIINNVRRANPDIEISVQIRTEGDVTELLDLLTQLEPDLDGISILTSADTVEFAEELLTELRPEPLPTTTPLPPTATPTPAKSAGTPKSNQTTEKAEATVTAVSTQEDGKSTPVVEMETAAAPTPESPTVVQAVETTPEANQRAGSNLLFIVIGSVVVIALIAGFFSRRAGSGTE